MEGNIYAYVFFLLVEQTQETNFIAEMHKLKCFNFKFSRTKLKLDDHMGEDCKPYCSVEVSFLGAS